jgi:hypothetical protein
MFEDSAEEFFSLPAPLLSPQRQRRCFLGMIDPVTLPAHCSPHSGKACFFYRQNSEFSIHFANKK